MDTQLRKYGLMTVAKVLVVILLAVSPRALLAPTSSFTQSQESKRPKTPKNIVRATSVRISNLEKQGREPRLPRTEICRLEQGPVLRRPFSDSGLPFEAFSELTKPDYLRPSRSSLPQAQSSPPA